MHLYKGGKGGAAKLTPSEAIKSPYVRLLVLGIFGIFLIVLGSSSKMRGNEDDLGYLDTRNLKKQEEELAQEIEAVVSSILGVGKVKASVTLESGPESYFSKSTTSQSSLQQETLSDGAVRESQTSSQTAQPVSGRLSAGDSPLVEKVCAPKVAGCLLVAQGASSSKVKMEIYRALEALLNIPIYKIQVTPMEGGK